jgi:NADH-quinone oxidoreductase subunit C
MSALTAEAIAARVCAAFPALTADTSADGTARLSVPAADLPAVAHFARTEPDLAFDALMDLTGYDLLGYPAAEPSDAIAVLYLLHSMRHRHKLTLRVLAPRSACSVPTASGEWPAALYFEREVWDLLGVRFEGHPSLERIMCPDDWVGHPLRKDYVYPDDYHGVAHLRDGQRFEGGPRSPSAAPAAAPAGSNGA